MIRSVKCPLDVRFYRFDLKDFFLSGSHPLLTKLCTEAVVDKYKDTFAKLCAFVLQSQYVRMHDETQLNMAS